VYCTCTDLAAFRQPIIQYIKKILEFGVRLKEDNGRSIEATDRLRAECVDIEEGNELRG